MNVDEATRIVQADMPDRAVPYVDVVRLTLAGRVLAAEVERLQAIVDPLNALREGFGSSVLVPCDNGLSCHVSVCGGWTDWHTRRFEAESLARALARAAQAKHEAAEAAGGE